MNYYILLAVVALAVQVRCQYGNPCYDDYSYGGYGGGYGGMGGYGNYGGTGGYGNYGSYGGGMPFYRSLATKDAVATKDVAKRTRRDVGQQEETPISQVPNLSQVFLANPDISQWFNDINQAAEASYKNYQQGMQAYQEASNKYAQNWLAGLQNYQSMWNPVETQEEPTASAAVMPFVSNPFNLPAFGQDNASGRLSKIFSSLKPTKQ